MSQKQSMSDRQVAIVTGVSEPISAATALRLARRGMAVLVSDPARHAANAVVDAEPDLSLAVFNIDLAAGGAQQLMDYAHATFGRLDVLVNGVPATVSVAFRSGDIMAAGAAALLGWTACVEAAVPLLAVQGGTIVNIVTAAGRYRTGYFLPESRSSSNAPQALANGAILALTRQLAMELAPKRIRVNAVVAGLIDNSPELANMTETERRFLLEEISLGRTGRPDEIAAVAAFLASPASSYVTGDAIDVNGGWWMS